MIWNQLTIYVKSIIQLALLCLLLYLIYLSRSIILYFIIAAIISLIAKPITMRLVELKVGKFSMPGALAAVLTMVMLLLIVTLVNMLILPQFIKELAFLRDINYLKVLEALESKYESLLALLASADINVNDESQGLREGIINFLNVDTLSTTFNGIAGGLGNLAAATFSILFMLFFFLKEKNLTITLVDGAIPDRHLGKIKHIIPKVKHILGRYFRGLLLQMLGIFTLVYVGLTFVAGVQNALVIAIFAALINLIPYIGPIIGAAFGLFIGVGQAYALGVDPQYGYLAIKIIAVFGVTQLTDNMLFQPLIFSNSVNAHPLEIFIVIAIAGTLFGATGMIVAVPVYSVLRIFFKEFAPNIKFVQSLTKNL